MQPGNTMTCSECGGHLKAVEKDGKIVYVCDKCQGGQPRRRLQDVREELAPSREREFLAQNAAAVAGTAAARLRPRAAQLFLGARRRVVCNHAPPAMKLLFLADLHFALKQYDWVVANSRDCDLIMIGGDLLDLSSPLDLDTQINVVEKYLTVLRRNAPLAISSGNHDGDSRNAGDESVAHWIQESRADGIHVDGDSFDLGELRVTVCPWWDGPLSRAEIDAQLAREAARQPRRWIWIHHAPPSGAHTCWTGRKAIGDDYLRGWIERYQPEMVLSGHIHNAPFFEPQGSWIDRIGRTWVFNPGRLIGSEPTSITIDLDTMTAHWRSVTDRVDRDLAALPASA